MSLGLDECPAHPDFSANCYIYALVSAPSPSDISLLLSIVCRQLRQAASPCCVCLSHHKGPPRTPQLTVAKQ